MNAATISVSPLACWMISAYQRYVSPHKGFRCAYRARRRKRASCSQFAKRAFGRVGMFLGALLLRRRFAKCRAASEALAAKDLSGGTPVLDYEPRRGKRESDEKRRQESSCWDGCDPVPSPGDCGSLANGCDASALDGACDVGGSAADCGDCGSCDVSF